MFGHWPFWREQRQLRHRLAVALGIAVITAVGLVPDLGPRPVAAAVPLQPAAPPTLGAATNRSCRFGINAPGLPITAFDTTPLRLGWYIDYGTALAPARPGGIDYAQVIHLEQVGADSYRSSPSGDRITAIAQANPGATWIIGNEPDRRFVQDDIEPHVYALAYHDLYATIKAADPTAQIYAGAIVQPTPLRLLYLDLVLTSYQQQFGAPLPTDGWAIHNFILNEASCEAYGGDLQICWGADIPPGIDVVDGMRITVADNDNFDLFKAQIVRFRQWMAKRGYRGQPVLLSEYGVLMPPEYGFPASDVNAYMEQTFDYLLTTTDPALGDPTDEYRLVQRFAWYSTTDRNFNGYIYDAANSPPPLTAMGQHWASYVITQPHESELYPLALTYTLAPPAGDGSTDIDLTVRVTNSGNAQQAQGFTVRFFNGDPTQGGQLIGEVETLSVAGCGAERTATLRWADVAMDEYHVFAEVVPADSGVERNLTNNTISTHVFFATNRVYLPAVMQLPSYTD
jgi:hypothetical protein